MGETQRWEGEGEILRDTETGLRGRYLEDADVEQRHQGRVIERHADGARGRSSYGEMQKGPGAELLRDTERT